jgi:hypothetical protein
MVTLPPSPMVERVQADKGGTTERAENGTNEVRTELRGGGVTAGWVAALGPRNYGAPKYISTI